MPNLLSCQQLFFSNLAFCAEINLKEWVIRPIAIFGQCYKHGTKKFKMEDIRKDVQIENEYVFMA